jgi:adenine/guanine phosphoribosyltransferase-like PRPP-binding protein
VRKLGWAVQALAFLVELEFLNGRSKIPNETVYSVLKYSA